MSPKFQNDYQPQENSNAFKKSSINHLIIVMTTCQSKSYNFSQNPNFKRGNFNQKSTSQSGRRAYGV